MAEYINKEEAYRNLNSLYNDLDSLDEEDPELWVDGFIGIAIGKIEDIPAADVVEVVRCKDCKFRKTEYCSMYYECECGHQSSWEYDNYFCSFGKRKENENG